MSYTRNSLVRISLILIIATAITPVSTWRVAGQVPPNEFSVSVSSSSLTITAGSSASDTITVNLVSGEALPVNLTVSGLPAGVTGAFNASTGTPRYASLLTLSTTSAVAAGTYSVNVTGSRGSLTHTATISLTVQPPSRITDLGLALIGITAGVLVTGGFLFWKKKKDECKDECKEKDDPKDCDSELLFDLVPAETDPEWLKKLQDAEKKGKQALRDFLDHLPGQFKPFGKLMSQLVKNMPDASKLGGVFAKKQGVDVWVMVVCKYKKCEQVPCKKPKNKKKWVWVEHTETNPPHQLTPPEGAEGGVGKKSFNPQIDPKDLQAAIDKAVEANEDVKKEKEACKSICSQAY